MFESIRTGRIKWFAVLVAISMAIFVVRLFYLQVIRHDYYAMQANAEQMKQWNLPAVRGEIYSFDNGQPTKLVLNETVYTVWVDPKVVTEPGKVISVLKKVAGGNVVDNFEGLLDKKDTRYQVLAKKVSDQQAAMIKKERIYGLGFERGVQRVYPEGQLGSQILGFVNAAGEGQYGIEEGMNSQLTGTDGLLKSVKDVRDVPLTIGNENVMQPAKNGQNLVLSIDRSVQAYTEKALADGLQRTGAKTGSVIVMDPRDGHVMAMASLPTYDPSKLGEVTDVAAFNNNTISRPYEPGSDIKTFTVAMGLDTGTIQPSSTYVNTDYIQVNDRVIANALKGHTGTITMQDALNYSLNTGMVTIMQRLGDGSNITLGARQKTYDYFHDRLRLGQLTGIELAHESAGTVHSPDDPEGNAVRYSNMAFGQGMDVTMVQVAAAFSGLINGGTYYQPTVIAGTISDEGNYKKSDPTVVKTGIINATTSDTMRDMIVQARRAFYASNDKPGYQIGGKTGTSQAIKDGKYVFNETIGTYLGFGGETVPRYVIMVEISSDGMALEGGKHAMPIFTDISNWMIDYLQLQPRK